MVNFPTLILLSPNVDTGEKGVVFQSSYVPYTPALVVLLAVSATRPALSVWRYALLLLKE